MTSTGADAMRAQPSPLLDLNVDALIIVDEQGLLRFANPAAAQLLGNEAIGRPFQLPPPGNDVLLRRPGEEAPPRCLKVHAWPGIWDGGEATLARIDDVRYSMLADMSPPAGAENNFTQSSIHPEDRPADLAAEAARPRCILVVEDQVSIRRLVRRILISEGFRVLEAEDAATALEQIEAHRDEIDLLLTDVVMPGLSGPELATRVSVMCPELQVLFMSGYNNGYLNDAGEGVSTAVPSDRFLQKPFSVEQLLERIHQALGPRPPSSGNAVDGGEQ